MKTFRAIVVIALIIYAVGQMKACGVDEMLENPGQQIENEVDKRVGLPEEIKLP